MNDLKKLLILFFALFFLTIGTAALFHSLSEGTLEHHDKDHCSICVFVFIISNAVLVLFVFLVFSSAISRQIIKRKAHLVIKLFFLPPSLAPPVIV